MQGIVEVCGLAQVLGKDIRDLSHGYRQRVGLGQALVHDPPILILDEPTSDLDPNEKAEVIQYIKEIGKERTILLSTHNLSEVETACARAIIVSKGRVVADGPLDEIRAKSGKVRYVVTVHEQKVLEGVEGYRASARSRRPRRRCRTRSRGLPERQQRDRAAHRRQGAQLRALGRRSATDIRAEIFQLMVAEGLDAPRAAARRADPRGRVQDPHQGRRAQGSRPQVRRGRRRRGRGRRSTPPTPRPTTPTTTRTTTTTRTRRTTTTTRTTTATTRTTTRTRRRREADEEAGEEEGLTPMSTTLTIAKREFRSYFDSPLAYVVICLGLIVLGVVFFYPERRLLAGRPRHAAAALRRGRRAGSRSSSCPVVTMRLLAEEKRSGTLEMLITLPVRDHEVILGKFLGAWGLVLVLIAATALYPLMMFKFPWHLGALDSGPGARRATSASSLFSAAAVAIGLLISALTESQVIAFFITFVDPASCCTSSASASRTSTTPLAARRGLLHQLRRAPRALRARPHRHP